MSRQSVAVGVGGAGGNIAKSVHRVVPSIPCFALDASVDGELAPGIEWFRYGDRQESDRLATALPEEGAVYVLAGLGGVAGSEGALVV